MLHGHDDVGKSNISSFTGGDQVTGAALSERRDWSNDHSSIYDSSLTDLRRHVHISKLPSFRTLKTQVVIEKPREEGGIESKPFRLHEFQSAFKLKQISTEVTKKPHGNEGDQSREGYQNVREFNMTKDRGKLGFNQRNGNHCENDQWWLAKEKSSYQNLCLSKLCGHDKNDCDEKRSSWTAVDPLLDGRCQTTKDHPYWDPDFWIPRRPLARGRLYHFNVVYHHARTRLSRTEDSDLALRVTTALVERLEMRGYVNSYYHDRDHRHENTMACELERVLAESSVTILLLTPGFVDQCLSSYLNIPAFRQLVDCPHPNHRLLTLSVGVPSLCVPQPLLANEVLYFQQDWQLDIPTWTRFDTAVMGFLQEQKEKWVSQQSENLGLELVKYTSRERLYDSINCADLITKFELSNDIADGKDGLHKGGEFDNDHFEDQRKLKDSELLDKVSPLYDIEMSIPVEEIYNMPTLYKRTDDNYPPPANFVQMTESDHGQILTDTNIDETCLSLSHEFVPNSCCQLVVNDDYHDSWSDNKVLNICGDDYNDKHLISTLGKAQRVHDTEQNSFTTLSEAYHSDQTISKSRTTASANQLLIEFSNKLYDRLTADEMEDVIILPEPMDCDDAHPLDITEDSEDEELSVSYLQGHRTSSIISWKETFQETSELTSTDVSHNSIRGIYCPSYLEGDRKFSHVGESFRKFSFHDTNNRITALNNENTGWTSDVTGWHPEVVLDERTEPSLIDVSRDDTDHWTREGHFDRNETNKNWDTDYDRLDFNNEGSELDTRQFKDSHGTIIWDTDDSASNRWTTSYQLSTKKTVEEKFASVYRKELETPQEVEDIRLWKSMSLDEIHNNDVEREISPSLKYGQSHDVEFKPHLIDDTDKLLKSGELSFEERLDKWAALGSENHTIAEDTYVKLSDASVHLTSEIALPIGEDSQNTIQNSHTSFLYPLNDGIWNYETCKDGQYSKHYTALVDFLTEVIDYLSSDHSVNNGNVDELNCHHNEELDTAMTVMGKQDADREDNLKMCSLSYENQEVDLSGVKKDSSTESTTYNLATHSKNTEMLSDQHIIQSLTENNKEADSDIIDGKLSAHTYEERTEFQCLPDQPSSQDQVRPEPNESSIDSHALTTLTLTQTTSELSSSRLQNLGRTDTEITSFSTIEIEDENRSCARDEQRGFCTSSSDVLHNVTCKAETCELKEQKHSLSDKVSSGFDITTDKKSPALEKTSTTVDWQTSQKYSQALSTSMNKYQQSNDIFSESSDPAVLKLHSPGEILGASTAQIEIEDCDKNVAALEVEMSEYQQTDNCTEIGDINYIHEETGGRSMMKNETKLQILNISVTTRQYDDSDIYNQSPETRTDSVLVLPTTSETDVTTQNERTNEEHKEEKYENSTSETVKPHKDNGEGQNESSVPEESWQTEGHFEILENRKDIQRPGKDACHHHALSLASEKKTHIDTNIPILSDSVDLHFRTTAQVIGSDEADSSNIFISYFNEAEENVKFSNATHEAVQSISDSRDKSVPLMSDNNNDSVHDNDLAPDSRQDHRTNSSPESPLYTTSHENKTDGEISHSRASTEMVQEEERDHITELSHSTFITSITKNGEGSLQISPGNATEATNEHGKSEVLKEGRATLQTDIEVKHDFVHTFPTDYDRRLHDNHIEPGDLEPNICVESITDSNDFGNKAFGFTVASLISNMESLQQPCGTINIITQSIIKQMSDTEEVPRSVNNEIGEEIRGGVLTESEEEINTNQLHIIETDQHETSEIALMADAVSNVPAVSEPIQDDNLSNSFNFLQNLTIDFQDTNVEIGNNVVAIQIAMEISRHMHNEECSQQTHELEYPFPSWGRGNRETIEVETIKIQESVDWPFHSHQEDKDTQTSSIEQLTSDGIFTSVTSTSSSKTSNLVSQVSAQLDTLSYMTKVETTAKSEAPTQQRVKDVLNASYATLGEDEDHVFFAGAMTESLSQIPHSEDFSLPGDAELPLGVQDDSFHEKVYRAIRHSPRNPLAHDDTVGEPSLSPRGLMYHEGDSGYFGEKPDSLPPVDGSLAAFPEKTERSANLLREPLGYDMSSNQINVSVPNENSHTGQHVAFMSDGGQASSFVSHAGSQPDNLLLHKKCQDSASNLSSASDDALFPRDNSALMVSQISMPVEQSGERENSSSMRQQSSDFRFNTHRADFVSNEDIFFSTFSAPLLRDTSSSQFSENQDSRTQNEEVWAAYGTASGDDESRLGSERLVTQATSVSSAGSMEQETGQRAVIETAPLAAEGGSTERTEPTDRANWLLEIYKGVCHTLARPDMPYLG